MPSSAVAVARWKKIRALLRSIRTFGRRDDVGPSAKPSGSAAAVVPFVPSTWSAAKTRQFHAAARKQEQYRSDVDLKLLMELVESIALFASLPYIVKLYVCQKLRYRTLHDGQVVYRQGDRITGFGSLYVVLDGVVSIYKNSAIVSVAAHDALYDASEVDDSDMGDCIQTVSVGEVFGEGALLGNVLRATTVLTQSRAKVVTLSATAYKTLLTYGSSSLIAAEYIYAAQCEQHRRSREDSAKLSVFLSHFHTFRCLPRPTLERIACKLVVQTFPANAIVLHQESTLAKLVVVAAGQLQIHVHDTTEGSKLHEALYGPVIGELSHGECFGEVALQKGFGSTQAATLRTLSPVTVIVLLQTDYDRVLCEDALVEMAAPHNDVNELLRLCSTPCADRAEDHVRTTVSALLRCDARIFWRQFNSVDLTFIAKHASITVVDAGTVLVEQNHRSDGMYMLLTGAVNIHRLTSTKVRRRQSVAVQVELHGGEHAVSSNEKHGQFLTSLGIGSAFGHVPLLTNSHSQSTYVVSRNLAKGITTATVLHLPAADVLGLLRQENDNDDEVLLFQPRLVLDNASVKPRDPTCLTLEKLATYLGHHDALRAVPYCVRLRLLQGMEIVEVRHNQLLWDVHEFRPHAIILVLAGSLLLVQSASSQHAILDDEGGLGTEAASSVTFDSHRTANAVTRMNSTDLLTTLCIGDVVGSMQSGSALQAQSAVAISEGKVGILHWGLLPPTRPALVELVDDIARWHMRHSSNDSTTDEGAHELTSQLFDMTGLRDTFPIAVQNLVHEDARFVTYQPGELVCKQGESQEALYIVLAGSLDVFVQRAPAIWTRRTSVDPKVTWRPPSKRKFVITERDDNPMKALMHLSKEPSARTTSIKKLLQSPVPVAVNGDRRGVREATLGPGDVICERALFDGGLLHPSTIVTTTAAAMLVLHRDAYENLVAFGRPAPRPSHQGSQRARDLWKLVVHFVLKKRAQRSQWPSVIAFARQKRIQLVLDIVVDVPCFVKMATALREQICERTLFQTFAPNAYVFTKGASTERVFVLVSGSVDLVQTAGTTIDLSTSTPLTSTSDAAELTGYVRVRTVNNGDVFGEYEVLAAENHRQISAIATHGARVVAINKVEYLQSWPGVVEQQDRLAFLQHTDALRALDRDRACSLWYGLTPRACRRMDVILPLPKASDALVLIQDGECIVQRQLALRRAIHEKSWREPTLRLDAHVATLSRGNVALCEDDSWHTLELVASSRDVSLLVLHYPGAPFMLQRILGKRGLGALRKVWRAQLEWHAHREEVTLLVSTLWVEVEWLLQWRMSVDRDTAGDELAPETSDCEHFTAPAVRTNYDAPQQPARFTAFLAATRPSTRALTTKERRCSRSARTAHGGRPGPETQGPRLLWFTTDRTLRSRRAGPRKSAAR
ncbi:hypothetical protein SDRG_13665 [Saprolegnia diclina VS20]|uniref:Cyclic nucleotide-binding domain-containing protein n=1 Tax=Saprolegnia diclina (strain VS20) TaxID=1156394 RepID=T0PSV8_SAPDV|nr:hypothetical protein SDRG_13665 [Saprolegnia diclina VS20]EQC28589.1 hypothetical protein SDRG_13665 [Saprolegnia diclina VS20]|eukprot:XP_008617986.1 hypothetical protein SDRG_13665 [Saprolegnia diclina VS20]